MKNLNIIKADGFFQQIEKIVNEKRLTYIDAIVYFCENNNIEIETAAALIKNNSKIKSNIQVEGEELNFLAKTARLPI